MRDVVDVVVVVLLDCCRLCELSLCTIMNCMDY
jgi:hypothetical protein